MNQQIVDLGPAKAEIVSYASYVDGPLLPALALKVAPEAKDALDVLLENMDNHDVFEISKITNHDERWTQVFMVSKDINEETTNLTVILRIPTSMLTVAFALMLVPGSFSLLLLRSPSARLEAGMVLDNRKRILSDIFFPPISDARHGLIQQTLASTTGNVYTGPLIPRGLVSQEVATHFEVDDFGVNAYSRAAQGRLLSVLSALTRGDVFAGSMALTLAQQLEEVYQFDVTDDLSVLSDEVRENVNIYRSIFKYLLSALLHSTPQEESAQVPLEEMDWNPRDFDMENSFVEIVSSFLEDEPAATKGEENSFSAWSMKYSSTLPEPLQAMRVPFTVVNIPQAQQEVHDYIKAQIGEKRYAKVINYAEYNWLREEVFKTVLEREKNTADIFLTMLLLISARALFVKENSSGNTPGTSYWLASMLTINGDSRLWEIMALAPALENYDVSALEDLMHTKLPESYNNERVVNFVYINLFMNGLAAFLLMEEVDKEDVEELCDSIDIKTKDVEDVKLLMSELIDMISSDLSPDDDDDDIPPGYTIPATAIRGMITRWSEPRLSRALSLAIPVLADAYAALEGHEIGTVEWSSYRKHQITEMLDYVDDIAPGVTR